MSAQRIIYPPPLLLRCGCCGEVKKHGAWVKLSDSERNDARARQVEWQATTCPRCLASQQPTIPAMELAVE